MTKELEVIYCVQCLSLKPREEAELVFRTGYYKVTTPLGRCIACANAERAAAAFRSQPADECGRDTSAKLA